MSKLWKKILSGFLIAVTGIVILVSLPLTLIVQPILWLHGKWTKLTEAKFYSTLEGKNFLVYVNDGRSIELIEEQILPHLSPNIELIALEEGVPYSDYPPDKISRMLYRLDNFSGFPHLVKIRTDKVSDLSVFKEFQELNQDGEGKLPFLEKLDRFFEIENAKGRKGIA